jgi:hypothetical protein
VYYRPVYSKASQLHHLSHHDSQTLTSISDIVRDCNCVCLRNSIPLSADWSLTTDISVKHCGNITSVHHFDSNMAVVHMCCHKAASSSIKHAVYTPPFCLLKYLPFIVFFTAILTVILFICNRTCFRCRCDVV